MPSAEYMKNNGVSKNNGISMNMEQLVKGGRHRLTDTYGRNMTDAEKAYYYSLSPRDVLAYDIMDVRKIYIQQGKYTPEIRQGLLDVIKRNISDNSNLFNK
jgi:filamentous hemagglutinin